MTSGPKEGTATAGGDPAAGPRPVTFVLLGAMAVTSIESIKRAMPARTWRRLHWTGMQLAWLAFTSTYTTAISRHPLYALPAALLLGIGVLRATAWWRARRRRQERAEGSARRAA